VVHRGASDTSVIGGEVLAEIAQVEKWNNAVGIDVPRWRSFPDKTNKTAFLTKRLLPHHRQSYSSLITAWNYLMHLGPQ